MTNSHSYTARPFDPEILRAYDIRGKVGQTLHPDDAYTLGLAFATFIGRRTGAWIPSICMGYDGRLSTPDLVRALTAGMIDSGARVIDVGLGPSPMLYYAVMKDRPHGGIMVTGSHNPPAYNGFKMLTPDGPVFGDDIRAIGDIAARSHYSTGHGDVEKRDIGADYIARLTQDGGGSRPLKIAWDTGNGAAGGIVRGLIDQLPGAHVLLYGDIDGRFPNHHPDPVIDTNLAALRETVLAEGCDFGVGFDGDGDRIGVIDNRGRVVRCDTLLALYARDVLARHPGATVIGDVKCSQGLFDEIDRLGGEKVICRTGHAPIKAEMIARGAPLAGELAGHIFFGGPDYYGFDDALYAALRLLRLVADSGRPLSALCDALPRWHSTPEIRVAVEESRKFAAIAELAAQEKAAGADICTVDGVRVSAPGGWWLVRASNTEPALTVRVEARTPEDLDRLCGVVEHKLRELGCAPPAALQDGPGRKSGCQIGPSP